MTFVKSRLFAALISLATLVTALADEKALRDAIARFAEAKNFNQTEQIVKDIAAMGDPAAALVLEALAEGNVQFRKSDAAVFVTRDRQIICSPARHFRFSQLDFSWQLRH